MALTSASTSVSAAQTHARVTAHPVAAPAAARLLSAARSTALQVQAAMRVRAAKQSPATAAKYTVKSGDTLSSIAEHFYRSMAYWPVLYWANHGQIRYANDIAVGQVLTVPVKPAKIPGAPSELSPAPAPAVTAPSVAPAAPAETEQSAPAQSAPVDYANTSYEGGSSFQQCVISRESGGNSQVMSSGGYYGLYQFSPSTWAEYGGNPADFGNASVAEQNQVFNNAISSGGESNWSSYDGC